MNATNECRYGTVGMRHAVAWEPISIGLEFPIK